MKNNKNTKQVNAILIILFAASIAGIIRSGSLLTSRSVDVLQLFVAGILFGLLVQRLIAVFRKPVEK